jgi:DNA-damage-inducible protein J
MSSKVLHIRLDEEIKNQASETLASMGLTVSEAVRVFLTQVVAQKQIPFDIKTPNPETLKAMQEADQIIKHKQARFSDATDLVGSLEQS